MKKILFLTMALAICSVSAASAARINVRVMDFTFQPATISAHVGDMIIWRWVNGNAYHYLDECPGGRADVEFAD